MASPANDVEVSSCKLSETERQLFQKKRLEEGYDLGDEKYLRWKEQVKVQSIQKEIN